MAQPEVLDPALTGHPDLRAKAERILALLIAAYGRPHWMPSLDPLSELVATVLSQHTSDVNSHRAFAQLRATFPVWEQVRVAPPREIAEAIRTGGLAEIKAPRIKTVLNYVAAHHPAGDGTLNLNFIADLALDDAKSWLRAIPGVGPKTAACVLMFGLNKPALPVDTHVYRVTRRLGLIDAGTTANTAHDMLEQIVPPDDVYAFHVDMVIHGRRVCKAPRPLCLACNLNGECDYHQGRNHSTTLSRKLPSGRPTHTRLPR